eukprot:gene8269-10167_t
MSTVYVDGLGYDAERFAKVHPGGHMFVALYGGRDATDAFATYHRRKFPHQKMATYRSEEKEDRLEDKASTSSSCRSDEDFFALCNRVNSFLRESGRGQGFAPNTYYIKVAALLIAAVVMEYHFISSPSIFNGLTLGLLFALIGLNIQHDANHGSISRQPWINTFLGFTQDWIGGNSLLWLQQHVAIHHTECNDLAHDKDMLETPLLRFSPLQYKYFWQRLQHIYFLVLEAGYATKVIFADWYNLLMNMYEGVPISNAVQPWRWWLSIVTRIVWIIRLIMIPLYLHGFQAYLPSFLAMAGMGGFYLAFFFLLSHNFDGVYHVVNNK